MGKLGQLQSVSGLVSGLAAQLLVHRAPLALVPPRPTARSSLLDDLLRLLGRVLQRLSDDVRALANATLD